MNRLVGSLLLVTVTALLAACGGRSKPTATPTPKPIPSPVSVRSEPQGITLADPTFKPLPGAKADFGHLGGSVYNIEVPDNWNGRLLLYQHGFESLDPEGYIERPGIRGYLIRHGWAWAASSYSSTGLIPGRAADETAALWDYFVRKYGQPRRTYVTGMSMGGAATNIAAERYADRYDGALQLCGLSQKDIGVDFQADYFAVGAYIAGVTQQEYDAAVAQAAPHASAEELTQVDFLANPLLALYANKIKPALADDARHRQFEDMMLDLTGGPRPYDRPGFEEVEKENWLRSTLLLSYGLVGNEGKAYSFGPLSDVSAEDFNAKVIRARARRDAFWDGWVKDDAFTGDIKIPLITVHTTGDWQTPIDQPAIVHRTVDGAGKGDLLVQRAVRAAGHCSFTNTEWTQSLEDLVSWVEEGKKPEGEDLTGSPKSVGRFTLAPRFGAEGADAVPGADQRVTLSGTVALADGGDLGDLQLYVVVRTDGREQPSCGFDAAIPIKNGRYETTVASAAEAAGCGGPGAELLLQGYSALSGTTVLSQVIAWPESRDTLVLDATMSSDADSGRMGASFGGTLLDATGNVMPPGTKLDVYAGTTLCAEASMPPVVMAYSGPDTYLTWVMNTPGCDENVTLTFKINGKPARETAVNDYSEFHTLDLTVASD